MFARGSRYEQVPVAVYVESSGREIPYKLLRVAVAEAGVQRHAVRSGDRLDLLAHRFYADPEQFWRICDGNDAMRPDDLLQEGRRLVIPVGLR